MPLTCVTGISGQASPLFSEGCANGATRPSASARTATAGGGTVTQARNDGTQPTARPSILIHRRSCRPLMIRRSEVRGLPSTVGRMCRLGSRTVERCATTIGAEGGFPIETARVVGPLRSGLPARPVTRRYWPTWRLLATRWSAVTSFPRPWAAAASLRRSRSASGRRCCSQERSVRTSLRRTVSILPCRCTSRSPRAAHATRVARRTPDRSAATSIAILGSGLRGSRTAEQRRTYGRSPHDAARRPAFDPEDQRPAFVISGRGKLETPDRAREGSR